ncbi:MAG: beta-N-acetylhexosaminidase [Flavobacteriaceae bacterium]|nr:MAG: beta-N-acetylhexosaminidase [Flavobacteriaceae bacterium]
MVLFSGFSFAQTATSVYLMPWPQSLEVAQGHLKIVPNIQLIIPNDSSDRIQFSATQFLRNLSNKTGVFITNGFPLTVVDNSNTSIIIKYDRIGKLEIHEDESYQISFKNNQITLTSVTDLGALHALETLLQLVNNNESYFYSQEVSIQDEPRFTWRGLMIDVARHFQPVDVIKRNLRGMASVKMNVFHWHLTDDQGFRIESKLYPKLQELGSDGLYYTHEQIKDIVKYADNLGIMVIPEIDIPGHATAFLAAYPELASKKQDYSIERNAGIFHPTLNPINPKTYEVLDGLFSEIAPLFTSKYVHIGGDENEGKHWDENPLIQAFKLKHGFKTNHDLQTYFNIKLEKILAKYGKKIMGWEEIMTPNMPTSAIIHSWKGVNEGKKPLTSLIEAAKKGYQTVLSNGFYIDLMQPVQEHYAVNPLPSNLDLSPTERKRVLGAEATLWSELATPLTIDSRIWPRTAAIAERFWSSENKQDLQHLQERLPYISDQLEQLGLTHNSYKNVLFRNITKSENIAPLQILSKVCEPLKIYTRNKGGTEYQSYSPFTLFADACTPDATDAVLFNLAVELFLKSPTENNKKTILKWLKKWQANHLAFKKLTVNPLIKNITPLSKNLAVLSEITQQKLTGTAVDSNTIKALLKAATKDIQDVELTVISSFTKLLY